MNILILNGSPRPQGNTAKMVAALKDAAEAVGHEVTAQSLILWVLNML